MIVATGIDHKKIEEAIELLRTADGLLQEANIPEDDADTAYTIFMAINNAIDEIQQGLSEAGYYDEEVSEKETLREKLNRLEEAMGLITSEENEDNGLEIHHIQDTTETTMHVVWTHPDVRDDDGKYNVSIFRHDGEKGDWDGCPESSHKTLKEAKNECRKKVDFDIEND